MPPPQTIPREILKWIQSLDLSYSVKDPKRDLIDSFLIAEIFSRYSSLFHFKVQMHAFDHTANTKKMKDNWGQLQKFFDKNDNIEFIKTDWVAIPDKDFD